MTASSMMWWSMTISMIAMYSMAAIDLKGAVLPILTAHLGIVTGLLLRHLVKEGDS